MNVRRLVIPVLAGSLVLAACKKDPPPEPTPPPAEAQPDPDSLRAAQRADSIRRAEEEAARLEEQRRQAVAAARATLEEMVFFDYDQSDIRPEAEVILRQKVDILRRSPAVRLRIEGHADERGSTEYNLALGSRRAEAVREFFVGFGLDPSRFETRSYGEERPLVNRSDEAAWARNRRAEFIITAGADQIVVSQD